MSEAKLSPTITFADLQLSDAIQRALSDVGYESPSPIQAATIPTLLEGRDVLGQAQTGTGKTAAFALPILSNLDIRQSAPQALVLAPTRELAIQVAEAFQTYARYIPDFHVLPIYGGQSYGPQLSALRRGVHVVVGTPGRVIDHLDKGSLDLSQLKTLVLDEADEMLRMGFIDDVERILQETPEGHQTALFSATMPSVIKRIAQTYLNKPAEITVAAKTGTADNIRQRYWLVSGMHKLDALTRILEAETFDGMIIFARTKLGTEELASKLSARGFSVAAINGDIQQAQRERTIQQLKDGKIDILVATDVAARGLDVERISHVVNYDVPYDPESYTHRIGRTGRAGRSGEAILFITPREKNLLKAIERATRQPVSPLELPTIQAVNDVRIARFKDQITNTLAEGELEQFLSVIESYEQEHNVPAIEIAAALAKMARGDEPLLLDKNKREVKNDDSWRDEVSSRGSRSERGDRPMRGDRGDRNDRGDRFGERESRGPRREHSPRVAEPGMRTFRIAVGHEHGVKPGNIVGAIANEANIESKFIGRIDIYDDYTVLDLPEDLPKDMLTHLKSVRVAGQALNIRADGEAASSKDEAPRKFSERTERAPRAERTERTERTERAERAPREDRSKLDQVVARAASLPDEAAPAKADKKRAETKGKVAIPMQTFRIEVGKQHAVTPGNIVGAIANEAGLDAKLIGHIGLFDDYSTVDLPIGMPKDILNHLKGVWVAGKKLEIKEIGTSTMLVNAKPVPLKERITGGNRRVAEKETKREKKPVTARGGSGGRFATVKAATKGKK
ncbi:DEAD/DEAH box helicase [Undibacterium fentianense]|uniref:ATP-dependent RNA helicase DeaD n=1 Tax=Undibacterium fentianense TaxID=2828728 RepID=A0A941IF64_9BURK|nr:DEAD/DEAH box helicase [Undibacterium fentianense]MBR7800386.1 DEAD/DEAH box helicase [Undibacterium fentianense]